MVEEIHKRNLHSDVGTLISIIRQKLWIPAIRQVVRYVLHRCVCCRKVSGRSYTAPDPPPLPKDRVNDGPPFTVTGVDFTGAIHVKSGYRKDKKVYICLFTCASSRAVHLEIVQDLSEESFLRAFRCFVSRRSLPRIMMSDNGSTFVAASNTIQQLTQSSKIQEELLINRTTWKFIPTRAPWFGGF